MKLVYLKTSARKESKSLILHFLRENSGSQAEIQVTIWRCALKDLYSFKKHLQVEVTLFSLGI